MDGPWVGWFIEHLTVLVINLSIIFSSLTQPPPSHPLTQIWILEEEKLGRNHFFIISSYDIVLSFVEAQSTRFLFGEGCSILMVFCPSWGKGGWFNKLMSSVNFCCFSTVSFLFLLLLQSAFQGALYLVFGYVYPSPTYNCLVRSFMKFLPHLTQLHMYTSGEHLFQMYRRLIGRLYIALARQAQIYPNILDPLGRLVTNYTSLQCIAVYHIIASPLTFTFCCVKH